MLNMHPANEYTKLSDDNKDNLKFTPSDTPAQRARCPQRGHRLRGLQNHVTEGKECQLSITKMGKTILAAVIVSSSDATSQRCIFGYLLLLSSNDNAFQLAPSQHGGQPASTQRRLLHTYLNSKCCTIECGSASTVHRHIDAT